MNFGGGKSLVTNGDLEALVEKGQFPQAVGEGVEIAGSCLKNRRICFPADPVPRRSGVEG